MHFASWSLAALATVAALLLAQSDAVAGKEDKSAEARPGSLEDELESSLPQPPQQLEEQLKTVKTAAPQPQPPKQPQPEQQPRPRHHPEQSKSDKPEGHRPSREELREMFHELLESMSEAERKSLTLRLGRDSVKRTFSRLRDELRAQPVAPSSVSKRAMPPAPPISRAKALRMRRSLLLGAMESGMSVARQRRKKRDLVDYSPEEYAQLVAMLAADRPGYIEDSDGHIRLESEDKDDGEGKEEKRGAGDSSGADAEDSEERGTGEAHSGGRGDDDDDHSVEDDGVVDEDDRSGHNGVDDDSDNERSVASLTESLSSLPPPPPPPPPFPRERQPLTMFLVRMAGEKGLFVPLNQEHAQQLAVDLAGEAAVAEAAEAQAAVEATAQAAAERLRREEGVAELKRFAEQLARRVPPGY